MRETVDGLKAGPPAQPILLGLPQGLAVFLTLSLSVGASCLFVRGVENGNPRRDYLEGADRVSEGESAGQSRQRRVP